MMTHAESELKVGPTFTGSIGCPSGSHMMGGQRGFLLVLEMLKVLVVQKKFMVSLV
jgi:hypothetical protein